MLVTVPVIFQLIVTFFFCLKLVYFVQQPDGLISCLTKVLVKAWYFTPVEGFRAVY